MLHFFRYLDIEKMEINKDKKKNRAGKESFEKFKAKCKLRKDLEYQAKVYIYLSRIMNIYVYIIYIFCYGSFFL